MLRLPICLFALALAGVAAHAQGLADDLGPVSLVSGNDYAPYADSTLPQGGMTAELVTRALAKVGLGSSIAWQPWSRGYYEAAQGRFSATFPYVRRPEREAEFLYSDVVVQIRYRLFTRASRGNTDYSRLESLKGKTYCVPLGWATVPALDEMVAQGSVKIVRPPALRNCVQMLAIGRVDFLGVDELLGNEALRASGVPPGTIIINPVSPLPSRDLYLIAPKSLAASALLIRKFNQGLALLRKSGEYEAIVRAHSR